jgi:hypothetical protein
MAYFLVSRILRLTVILNKVTFNPYYENGEEIIMQAANSSASAKALLLLLLLKPDANG